MQSCIFYSKSYGIICILPLSSVVYILVSHYLLKNASKYKCVFIVLVYWNCGGYCLLLMFFVFFEGGLVLTRSHGHHIPKCGTLLDSLLINTWLFKHIAFGIQAQRECDEATCKTRCSHLVIFNAIANYAMLIGMCPPYPGVWCNLVFFGLL